ncbi:unnamed protein product [Prunus armeniaca]|uniref:Uncharacterized protein n=1 Tax=Prunus armeniaca TaxID=36596 RepID=A0A6J5TXW9_PRUAR|nr:unnamed protein product [Prunus armeniaca]
MAPRRLKGTKNSTANPRWMSGEEAAKHASDFQTALVQVQSVNPERLYSPFPLTLRGPYKSPFLGPHNYRAKPEKLLSLDACLVRVPFAYGLESVTWGSWDAHLERLGLDPSIPLP